MTNRRGFITRIPVSSLDYLPERSHYKESVRESQYHELIMGTIFHPSDGHNKRKKAGASNARAV